MSQEALPVEKVTDAKGTTLAIILRGAHFPDGTHFATPHALQQQVAVMKREAGDSVPAHSHLPTGRDLVGTQEVLVVFSGCLRAEIFDSSRKRVLTSRLGGGDVIILISGGHGFYMEDDCFFVEVKQGPYIPGKDKVLFEDSESEA